MLTHIEIRNFKRIKKASFALGKTVVLIGPNNSGKTTALQALALWDAGLRRWNEKRGGRTSPEKRPGVTINRRDLYAIPLSSAKLLWHDLRVVNVRRVKDKPQTSNVFIDIILQGVTNGKKWECGLEFYYANEESFYCRPLRLGEGKQPGRMPIPPEAALIQVSFLPPMSGLSAEEPKLEPGRINVLLGEGQTAQVLRNMCYQIYERSDEDWENVIRHIDDLFGVEILKPNYILERGEIKMSYRETISMRELALSASGRGLQQTLLLLAHLYANPGTVLLLDEPDAHLEILRQRQTYQLITDIAEKKGSQIIAASHSEVVLNEAANRDIVIAFVGRTPHRIDDRGSQVLKSLKSIGFDQYYQAEQTGWVLYLEGSTDLAMLRAFAEKLGHDAKKVLERPFVHYVANRTNVAQEHFFGLREAKGDLVGIALYDRLDKELTPNPHLKEMMWDKREMENYLNMEETLYAYAVHDIDRNDLFGAHEAEKRRRAMQESIEEVSKALKTLRNIDDPWSSDVKATDDFLNPLFHNYFERLGLPDLMRKTHYHSLVRFVPVEKIDPDITAKLDAIVEVESRAKPRT